MPTTAVARSDPRREIGATAVERDELVARYQHLRSISREIHSGARKLVLKDALAKQAGRLGLRVGKTIVLDNPDRLDFLFDLLLYTAPPGRMRPIDRYAKSGGFAPGSEEAALVAAMQQARFALIRIERRHQVAGVVIVDVVRGGEVWLVDLGLEATAPSDRLFATRLYTPAEYSCTCGVIVPIEPLFMLEVLRDLPALAAKTMIETLEDRRFAERIYRKAFDEGVLDSVRLQRP